MILNAASIVNYNIYERTKRVDIMITFDMPFKSEIIEKNNNNLLVVTLKDVTTKRFDREHLNHKLLSYLEIKQIGNDTKFYFSVKNPINLKVAKTIDGYGLRMRLFSKENVITKTPKEEAPQGIKEGLNDSKLLKTTTPSDTQYILVLLILVFGVLTLYWLKKKTLTTSKTNSAVPNWLFNNKNAKIPYHFDVKFEKAIDKQYKIVLLEFNKSFYLVLLGQSAVLLDKFDSSMKPKDYQEFDSLLKENQAVLDELMKAPSSDFDTKNQYQAQGYFETYKNKASQF